jgi:hypothetical protein
MSKNLLLVGHSMRIGVSLRQKPSSAHLFLFLVLLPLAAAAASLQTQAEPVPSNAVQGILKAFDQFPLVAIGELHGKRKDKDFLISLIKQAEFCAKVNDIAVEFGMPFISLYSTAIWPVILCR